MTLIDVKQRQQATDPSASFIVQAPAGSGKTEILTQRYLRLLSTVSVPEQIVALTFTRKAASEMRERIMLALQQAATHQEASSAHQKMTLTFARQAIEQDARHQWHLLEHPNRLKIITLDSLCQSITQAIPLLEQHIGYAQITDKASHYYLEAARQCIQFALENPSYQEAITHLLLHVDNQYDKLLLLFKELLSKRDQWLTPLFKAKNQTKEHFEEALLLIEQHELSRFQKSLPLELAYQLVEQAKELACIENDPLSPRYLLQQWQSFKNTTPEMAKALCALILGSDANIRKSFDHHVGLKSSSCPKAQYQSIKENSKLLLEQLREYPDFLTALLKVSRLPNPYYDKEQWKILQALFLLLPTLVSHLHVLFGEENAIDFTAIAQQALSALGDEDEPTDLALYLDNAIHHLLIDEFQDTSILQYELLTRLVQGWQDGDRKTLFIVGDPMQSIYRFRQAEVGLFYRAVHHGLGPVKLIPLELQCNFRSTPTIIHWVNHHFASVFPKHKDIESGAVTFHPSATVLADSFDSKVHAIECETRQDEAQYLVETLQKERAEDPQQSIAILVRSRNQLPEIIKLLRQHAIPYQGIDIDLLAHLPHLRDVWSLTQALLMPGNRLSWLSLLRSPYCGMILSDVHAIASHHNKNSIYQNLLEWETIAHLSEDGRFRARFFINIMQHALGERAQMPVSDWVNQTLTKLYGNLVLNEQQKADLEQYWNLLDRYEAQGRLSSREEFIDEFNRLYSQQTTPSKLQIMTIHKSKGLEFDTVFLPYLGAAPSRGDNPLLRWLKLPTEQDELLLLSPIKGSHQTHCPLYDYLSDLDEEKGHYEIQRLLYVAATRAKKKLYLSDGSTKPSKSSLRSLLSQQEFFTRPSENEPESASSCPTLLQQLPTDLYKKITSFPNDIKNKIPRLDSGISRLTGIITHRLLQWICDNHPVNTEQLPWLVVTQQLEELGFDKKNVALAFSHIQEQINRLFADPTGLWIISPHHQEHNEYELIIHHNQRLVTRIIDRTFEAENELWVIDFKTGKKDDASTKQYKKQLTDYASHISMLTPLPIRCGLYYLANNHWTHWAYEPSVNPDGINNSDRT
ncbi:MAG: ATP-dependent DNA helicase [Legionella sp.]|nr:MAG: ATP-dependent DNA helicase [Legionella sp.]PJD98683.1 MAG: ATP-dependent DNA helicase [Legionella sp.]